MLSASARSHNPMNAGRGENSEYRTWMFHVYSENKADVHDVMKSICILSLAIPAQLLEVKDEIFYLGKKSTHKRRFLQQNRLGMAYSAFARKKCYLCVF